IRLGHADRRGGRWWRRLLLERRRLIRLAELERGLDRLAGLLVPRREVEDPLGVDVEGDLELDLSLRRRAEAGEDERAEQLVLVHEPALALVDAQHDRLLVVLRGRQRP